MIKHEIKFVFISIAIILAVYFIGIDFKLKVEESRFNIFLNFLNILITSYLTYLIYKISKDTLQVTRKATEVNEILTKITIKDLEIAQSKEIGKISKKLWKYSEYLEVIEKTLLTNVNVETMKDLVFDKIVKDDKTFLLRNVENISEDDIPSRDNLFAAMLDDEINYEKLAESDKKFSQLYDIYKEMVEFRDVKIIDFIEAYNNFEMMKEDNDLEEFWPSLLSYNNYIFTNSSDIKIIILMAKASLDSSTYMFSLSSSIRGYVSGGLNYIKLNKLIIQSIQEELNERTNAFKFK